MAVPRQSLPSVASAILRSWTPHAEREELLADLAAEYADRRARHGWLSARRWLWRQVFGSLPALARRSWWKGWTGFEPEANRMHPGGPPMESWIMDMRYAARRLRTRPTYALLAVLTLALGVGGTAAIFSIVRGLLLDPLPYTSERSVQVFWNVYDWSEAEFAYLKPQFPTAFAEVAAFRPGDVTLDPADNSPARLVPGIASTAELFAVLGARAAIGRTFEAGEDAPGAAPVAVISDAMWHQLGGKPDILGTSVRMGGVSRTIVGVMPPGFWFPDPSVQIWTPVTINAQRRSGEYALIGRLAPGATPESMGAPLAQITRLLGAQFQYSAAWDKTKGARLTPVREYLTGSLRPALLATAVAMVLILLIACANVAALMLGQVEGRTAELAVRSALGADRRRLSQQIVSEALMIGLLAGAAGAGLATAGFRLLVATLPLGAWAATARIDWSLFLVALATAVAASIAIAIIPTVSLWRGDVRGALSRVRTSAGGAGSSRMTSALVIGEVALAVLMAAGAALLIRSVTNLYAIDPGITTGGVAILDVTAPVRMPEDQRRQTVRDVTAALAGIPGIKSVGAAQRVPLRGSGDNWGITVEGKPDLAASTTALRFVSPEYLQTMGYRLVSGRLFSALDGPATDRVVVINEALAKQYFPGEDPIGHRLSTFDGFERIVGVIGNAGEANLTDSAVTARYMLYDQVPYAPAGIAFALRTSRPENAATVLDQARRIVQRVAPEVAVQQTTTMSRIFDLAVGPVRQVMGLLTILTGLAMTLGAIGIYGVIAHFVHRRKRDWGIRIALGLTPGRLIGQVVGRGLLLVSCGVVIGLVIALASSRLLGAMLYGIKGGDPLALTAATLALLVVGALAAYVPAHRASRTDPAKVLREQ